MLSSLYCCDNIGIRLIVSPRKYSIPERPIVQYMSKVKRGEQGHWPDVVPEGFRRHPSLVDYLWMQFWLVELDLFINHCNNNCPSLLLLCATG